MPEGADALALSHLAQSHGNQAVFVAVDDAAMARMQASLQMIGVNPEDILTLPAWDGLPYDRVSPNGVLVGQRLRCLAALQDQDASAKAKPWFLLTTINAWLQLLPPKSYFDDARLSIAIGQNMPQRDFSHFAVSNGYRRSETVRESGEYAIRGSIIDVFPPGYADPVRIDFFDTEVETIKTFDAETQRSTGSIQSLILNPVSELILNDDRIAIFRRRYLEHFGANASKDPLYASVSEGRHYPGMEHMLPLFHDGLVHLSDYTAGAPVMFDPDSQTAAQLRFDQIHDFYTARLEAGDSTDEDHIWRVLPPDQLYLTQEQFKGWHNDRLHFDLSRFQRQEGEVGVGVDIGGKRGAIYHTAPTENKMTGEGASASPSHAVAEAIPNLAKDHVVILAASTEGSRTRMDELIAEHLPARFGIRPVTQ